MPASKSRSRKDLEAGSLYAAAARRRQGPSDTADVQVPEDRVRSDGTLKDIGYLGKLKLPDGGVATEYSIGVPIAGREMEIPSLVPTLSPDEVNQMVNDIIPNKRKMPASIVHKAAEHAEKRVKANKDPFYRSGE